MYYRAISAKGFATERRGESNLLAHMLQDLAAPNHGVSLYVGHDTNLDGIAVMLSLAWPNASPYPSNTTVPGGILRFTTNGVGAAATVSAAFLYTDFKDASGNLTEVEAHFPNGKSTVTLSALRSMADERIDKRCVRL